MRYNCGMKTKPLTFLISLAVLLFCSPAMSETTRSLSDEENQFLNRFLNKKFCYGLYLEKEKFGHLYYDLRSVADDIADAGDKEWAKKIYKKG